MKRLFKKDRALYLITDRTLAVSSNIEIVRKAITCGVKTIQLREKKLSKKTLFSDALAIKRLTSRHGVTLIINDHIEIALAIDADGVHLGQDDMPVKEARRILGSKKIIGISTHSLKQAVDAQNGGADYIGFGPVFRTFTKDAGRPKGLKSLKSIKEKIKIPVAAIGGITCEKSCDVLNSGADALAVGSAILSGDMKTNIKNFLSVVRDCS